MLTIIKGIIYRSTGSWYQVKLLETGQIIDARARGKMRLLDQSLTNPLAVGDIVTLQKVEDGTYAIEGYDERKNVLLRKSIKKTDNAQIIAANIDQGLCIQSIVRPSPKEGFIDRFLVTCEAYGVKPIIFFSKTDLAKERDLKYLTVLLNRYQNLGYETYGGSNTDINSLSSIKKALTDKKTVLTGHSGVGKSTLINALDNDLDLKTGIISDYSEKGMHTTTFATMFDLSFGGCVIDTPGIKEFGLFNIETDELAMYFREFDQYRNTCKYDNCSHIHEPGCLVMDAFENGLIDASRYDSYMRIYESLSE